MQLTAQHDSWPLRKSFNIARGSKTSAETVCVTLSDGDHRGRGECLPYAHYGESVESVIGQIETLRRQVETGANRLNLQSAMPPGAARNAIDCAFWDLEAKQKNVRVWDLMEVEAPKDIVTAYTLSLDVPETMLVSAREHADRPLLKVKLGGPRDLECIKAVRHGAPSARLILDANEGWSQDNYEDIIAELVTLNIEMIEQPFKAGDDDALLNLDRPIPICADESCHDTRAFEGLVGKYDMINIKLDKTGGLTEALQLRSMADKAGMEIMVGCMVSTSLSMAPAMMLANNAKIVDLDGPLLLAKDQPEGLVYRDSRIEPPSPGLWG